MLSVIASGCRIIGNIECDGEIQVDGTIEGDLKGKTVVIGEKGSIKGLISGELVRVLGSVNGQIHSKAVELAKTARVLGDIHHDSLSVAAGAHVEGRFDRISSEKGSITALPSGKKDQVLLAAGGADAKA